MLGVALGHPAAGLAVAGDRPALVPRRVQLAEDARAALDERLDLEVLFPDRAVAQVLRQAGRNRSVGSRRCPSAETTKSFGNSFGMPSQARPTGRYRQRPIGAPKGGRRDEAVETTPARLDLGRLGRRRRARPHQPAHAREGAPGRARGRGRHQLLPQPARSTSRAAPRSTSAATRRGSRRPRTSTAIPRSSTTSTRRTSRSTAARVTSTCGPTTQVTLSLQYSTQWDSLAHAGAEFDADGDGVEEARLLQRLPRRASTSSGRGRRRGRRQRPRVASRTTSVSSTWRSTACRDAACSSTSRTTSATSSAASTAQTLEEIMAADNVVVEPGDMLLIHTGFATKVLEWNREPDPVEIHRTCTYLDAHDDVAARVDRRLADRRARRRQLRGRRNGRRQAPRGPALAAADPPPLPVQARRPARRAVVPARARDRGCASTTAAASCSPRRRCACPARRLAGHPDRDRLSPRSNLRHQTRCRLVW